MWGKASPLLALAALCVAGCTLDFDRFERADGGDAGAPARDAGLDAWAAADSGGRDAGNRDATPDDDAGDPGFDAGVTCEKAPCDALASCDDSSGEVVCKCPDGYDEVNGGRSCADIDECKLGTTTCHADGKCINSAGSSRCECNAGFNGDGMVSCKPNALCESGGTNCAGTASCMTIDGNDYCVCGTGYEGDGEACTDIDECAINADNCHNDANCSNNAGAFTCACKPNYMGNGVSCTDVDECATNNGGCDTAPDACVNSAGTFACTCPSTFQGAGVGANGCYAVRQISTGFYHTCARFADGIVKCWGGNGGALGVGDTNDRGDGANEMGTNLPAVNLGTGRSAVDIAAGDSFSCALLDNGRIKCWGAGGALGQGNTAVYGDSANEVRDMGYVDLGSASSAALLATSIRAGSGYACAILANGSMKCWGRNEGGQLGVGSVADADMSGRWGDAASEMGNNLPAITLPFGIRAISLGDVYTGYSHTCALSQSFGLYCWGGNAFGQIGLGNSDFTAAPSELVNVGTNRTIISMSAGFGHTCAIIDGDELKCWGVNDSGELGLGNTVARGDGVGEMGNMLPVVPLAAPVAVVEAGFRSTCALHTDATVRCWGNGGMVEFGGPPTGQLGRNSTSTLGDGAGEVAALTPINFGTAATVTQISLQYAHGCAVFHDGRVKCWGYNDQGQLGLGDTNNRGDEANEVGAGLPFVDLRP